MKKTCASSHPENPDPEQKTVSRFITRDTVFCCFQVSNSFLFFDENVEIFVNESHPP